MEEIGNKTADTGEKTGRKEETLKGQITHYIKIFNIEINLKITANSYEFQLTIKHSSVPISNRMIDLPMLLNLHTFIYRTLI